MRILSAERTALGFLKMLLFTIIITVCTNVPFVLQAWILLATDSRCRKNCSWFSQNVAVYHYHNHLYNCSFCASGLDPSGYRQSVRAEEDDEEDLVTVQLTIEERFRDSERFTFNCPAPTCGRQVVLDAPFIGNVSLSLSDFIQF